MATSCLMTLRLSSGTPYGEGGNSSSGDGERTESRRRTGELTAIDGASPGGDEGDLGPSGNQAG